MPGIAPAAAQPVSADPRPLDTAFKRRAFEVREVCAGDTEKIPIAPHPTNGDEARYTNKIGSDSRGLPHDKRGEVEQAAWQALYTACQSGDSADFEKIPLGGTRKLVNPIGTEAVSLSGINPTQIAIPPAPALASAERGGEAVEVYWQSLLRDVPLQACRFPGAEVWWARSRPSSSTAQLHACKTEFHAWPVHRCSHASGCNTVHSTPAPQQSGRRREERLRVTRGSGVKRSHVPNERRANQTMGPRCQRR